MYIGESLGRRLEKTIEEGSTFDFLEDLILSYKKPKISEKLEKLL